MPRMKIEATGKSYTIEISQLGTVERVKKVGAALGAVPFFIEMYTGMKSVLAVVSGTSQSDACAKVRKILKEARV